MQRLGPIVVMSADEHDRLKIALDAIGDAAQLLNEQQDSVAKQLRRLMAVVDEQTRLLRQARLDRDLAQAKAKEYQELFGELMNQAESLQRQLTIARHPSTGPAPE